MIHFLCPLAGIIADNKIGRHRMIRLSTWMLVIGISLSFATIIIVSITQSAIEKHISFTIFLPSCLLILTLAVFTIAIAGFEANSVQFGIDQLLDSPWEDQSIFIYWYVWIWTLAYFAYVLHKNIFKVDYFQLDKQLANKISSGIIMAALLVFTLILLFLTSSKRRWFLTDLRRYNPYKLVYKVTKFSRIHKVPVNRSAFTYCEDEIPSGLDVGKAKYGGPFTTEEVEDVKAFYGILKVIFTSGPAFLLLSTFFATVDNYQEHFIINKSNTSYTVTKAIKLAFIDNLIVFIIPLYLVILRPLISYYIPSMLKRMAVGFVVPTLSAVIFLVVDSLAHAQDNSLPCMFSSASHNFSHLESQSKVAVYVSHYYDYIRGLSMTILYLTWYMIHVAQFEFICSQSPHIMKGLLIGLSFVIEGLYSFIGTILPVVFQYSWPEVTSPSCYLPLSLSNIVFGLVALSLYVYVTRGYQYRMRDEPCHVHRYVEEYYSKITENNYLINN